VDGPVLRPFLFGDDPYRGGLHRGVDIAASPGAAVGAPTSGRVSFAGTVPGGGRTLTIETVDGYSVTLLHLGALGVGRGAAVGEGDRVAIVGPSDGIEHTVPYVHLGVRVTTDPQGYLDPLSLLPPPVPAAPEETQPDPSPDTSPESPTPVDESDSGEPEPAPETPELGVTPVPVEAPATLVPDLARAPTDETVLDVQSPVEPSVPATPEGPAWREPRTPTVRGESKTVDSGESAVRLRARPLRHGRAPETEGTRRPRPSDSAPGRTTRADAVARLAGEPTTTPSASAAAAAAWSGVAIPKPA